MFLPKCSQDMYKICAPSVHLTKISFFWIYRSNYDTTWRISDKNSISYIVDVSWLPPNESASLFYWEKFFRDGQLSVSQQGRENFIGSRNTGIFPFYTMYNVFFFGFHKKAFVWKNTRENFSFCNSKYRFFTARESLLRPYLITPKALKQLVTAAYAPPNAGHHII